MNLKQLQIQIDNFNQERDWKKFHTPENLAKSISIEAAELLECFQWDENYDISALQDELADILIYSFNLAHNLNIDIEEIIQNKLKKNSEKYPVEKSKGNSKKYTEF